MNIEPLVKIQIGKDFKDTDFGKNPIKILTKGKKADLTLLKI